MVNALPFFAEIQSSTRANCERRKKHLQFAGAPTKFQCKIRTDIPMRSRRALRLFLNRPGLADGADFEAATSPFSFVTVTIVHYFAYVSIPAVPCARRSNPLGGGLLRRLASRNDIISSLIQCSHHQSTPFRDIAIGLRPT